MYKTFDKSKNPPCRILTFDTLLFMISSMDISDSWMIFSSTCHSVSHVHALSDRLLCAQGCSELCDKGKLREKSLEVFNEQLFELRSIPKLSVVRIGRGLSKRTVF